MHPTAEYAVYFVTEYTLTLAAAMFATGLLGFCLSFFGFLASLCLLMMTLAVGLTLFALGSHVKKVGLLAFLPKKTQEFLTTVSIFDILVNIIIHRKMSKMISAILSPFFAARTPEEVRMLLKEEGKVPVTVYRTLFRKGLVNSLPKGARSIMFPSKQDNLKKQLTDNFDLEVIEEEPQVQEITAETPTPEQVPAKADTPAQGSMLTDWINESLPSKLVI